MDNNLVQKIREELSKSESIAIAVGQNPSVDSMAAALSLYLILKEANKKVAVISPTEPLVEHSSLVGIDKVTTSVNSGGGPEGDFVVSFPYVEGEIEKVSYTLENGFLNIIVKSAGQPLSFDEKDVRYTKASSGGASFNLLITVGMPVLSELGSLIDKDKMRDVKIINMDNKQENQGYGDIVAVSPSFSSVSEQVADMVLTLGIRIDKDIAQNLLNGITYSTRNFQADYTSPLAFEIASFLMRSGAQRAEAIKAISGNYHEPKGPDRQVERAKQRPFSNEPQDEPEEQDEKKAPVDWLSPKVYKGSSNF